MVSGAPGEDILSDGMTRVVSVAIVVAIAAVTISLFVGAAAQAVFTDADRDLALYSAVHQLWYDVVGDRDEGPGIAAEVTHEDLPWLDVPTSGREWVVKLTSSRWKSGPDSLVRRSDTTSLDSRKSASVRKSRTWFSSCFPRSLSSTRRKRSSGGSTPTTGSTT